MGILDQAQLTCDDLTVEAHGGWYIAVEDPARLAGVRYLDLGSKPNAIRRWTNNDGPQVGLLDVSDTGTHGGLFVGSEHMFPTAAKVVLIQPLTAKAKRHARQINHRDPRER